MHSFSSPRLVAITRSKSLPNYLFHSWRKNNGFTPFLREFALSKMQAVSPRFELGLSCPFSPRFELGSSCPLPTTVTITPQALSAYIALCIVIYKSDCFNGILWKKLSCKHLEESWQRWIDKDKITTRWYCPSKSQTCGNRKIPLTLLLLLQVSSGSVSKSGRREVVFSSQSRKNPFIHKS